MLKLNKNKYCNARAIELIMNITTKKQAGMSLFSLNILDKGRLTFHEGWKMMMQEFVTPVKMTHMQNYGVFTSCIYHLIFQTEFDFRRVKLIHLYS